MAPRSRCATCSWRADRCAGCAWSAPDCSTARSRTPVGTCSCGPRAAARSACAGRARASRAAHHEAWPWYGWTATQRELSRTTLVLTNQFDPDGVGGPPQAALQPSPDGRFAYLALAARSATRWRVSLEVIDLSREAVVGSVDLLAGPQANLSETREVQLPVLRIAPDGRHALIMAAVRQETALGTSLSTPHAWIVDLDGVIAGIRDGLGRRRESLSPIPVRGSIS